MTFDHTRQHFSIGDAVELPPYSKRGKWRVGIIDCVIPTPGGYVYGIFYKYNKRLRYTESLGSNFRKYLDAL